MIPYGEKKKWKSLGDFQFTFNLSLSTSLVSYNFRSRHKNKVAELLSKIIYQHCHCDDIRASAPWNIKCESQVEFQLMTAKRPGVFAQNREKSS